MKIRSKLDVMARQYGETAATTAQKALAQSADLVATIPARTRGAIKGARSLVARAEPLVTPVVEAQLETLEVVATMGAKRLKAASEAESLDGLVKAQVALFPETKAAALGEARKYLEMFFSTKADFDAAMQRKVLAWVTPKVALVDKKVRKTATPAAAAA